MVVGSWASGAAWERRGRDDTNHKRPEASTHAAPTASKEYRLKAGQGYLWKIKAATDFEYGLIAPAFFRNIWIRKIETGSIEVKTAPLDELEFKDEGEG